MLLAVDIGGAIYIADPGFSGFALTTPLKLKAESEQKTPHETFRLMGGDPDWQLEVKLDDAWKPLYSFDLTEHGPGDYDAANAFVGNDPSSPSTTELRVALAPTGKRLKLKDNRFTTYPEGQPAQTRLLGSVAELREVLAGRFGITLPDDARLEGKLEAIIARHAVEP